MFFHHFPVRVQRYAVFLAIGISTAIGPSISPAQNVVPETRQAKLPPSQIQIEALTVLAEDGDMNAQFRLGTMYMAVQGVPAIEEKGRVWLKRAAAQGHIEARKKLAKLGYPNGFNFDAEGKFVPTKPTDITWDSLSDKPPAKAPNFFEQFDEKKPSANTLIDLDTYKPKSSEFQSPQKPSANTLPGNPYDQFLDKPIANGAEQNNHRSPLPTGTVGAVLAGVLLAFACCYSLFWLLGKSVKGSTPVATGRRWMNWVVLLALMQPLTKVFSLLIGGYGDPGKELALGVAGAVVLGFAAFVIGALWSRWRPKTRQAMAEAKAEVEQYRNGWPAEGARMSSASNAPQTQPTASTPTPVDEMPVAEIVIAGGAVNQENAHLAQVEKPLKTSATATTDAEQEDFWAAAMAEVERAAPPGRVGQGICGG